MYIYNYCHRERRERSVQVWMIRGDFKTLILFAHHGVCVGFLCASSLAGLPTDACASLIARYITGSCCSAACVQGTPVSWKTAVPQTLSPVS